MGPRRVRAPDEAPFLPLEGRRFRFRGDLTMQPTIDHAVYVLHVKPRTEKKVFAYLASYGCARFLPLYVKVTKVQRRKVKRELPLFPGYVFASLPGEWRRKMLETNLLVRLIPVLNARELVHQLRQVNRLAKRAPDLKVTNPFKTGDRVRVKTGPFTGLEGHVRREGAKATIVVTIDILGQAVESSISPADCELAEKT